MSRIIIDVTGEQHQQIKALAALQGKSIKDYVLEKVFSKNKDDEAAWQELTNILESRIKEAEANPLPSKSFEELLSIITTQQVDGASEGRHGVG